MSDTHVIVVHLRRPRSVADEMRSDPFWEFGSFGITGCHSKNLMHPRNAEFLQGARFAFAQGGRTGMRLVYLTPHIRIISHRARIEAIWTPAEMPFCYSEAPKLANNQGEGDFQHLEATLKHGKRKTVEGQFSSQFRSRATPLENALAEELIRTYSTMRAAAEPGAIATCYADALPWSPPLIDRERERTYASLLSNVRR